MNALFPSLAPDFSTYADEESRAQRIQDEQDRRWSDLEILSEVFASFNSPVDFGGGRETGRDALEALQRAYRATTDQARRLAVNDFGRIVYHGVVDFIEAAAEGFCDE